MLIFLRRWISNVKEKRCRCKIDKIKYKLIVYLKRKKMFPLALLTVKS